MLTYKKLARKPRSFQSFTGISLEQFDFLSSEIEKEYKRTEQRRLSRKKRERKIGAGRRFALPVRDRLMMLLVYYRMYITYELAGHLFGLDQSNVYRDIRYMEPAVRGSIPIPQKMMYAESKKIGTIQDLERHFPEFCVMIDSGLSPNSHQAATTTIFCLAAHSRRFNTSRFHPIALHSPNRLLVDFFLNLHSNR